MKSAATIAKMFRMYAVSTVEDSWVTVKGEEVLMRVYVLERIKYPFIRCQYALLIDFEEPTNAKEARYRRQINELVKALDGLPHI